MGLARRRGLRAAPGSGEGGTHLAGDGPAEGGVGRGDAAGGEGAGPQGVLAGVGYAVAGAPSPLILTLMTILIAFIPFGTPFAWGGVVVYMLAQGHVGPALGLLVWCVVVVSWVDNIIRPALISGATELPFLVVMFGVLGGLTAFGMVGIFVGPVLLAVLLGLWHEWLDPQLSPGAVARSAVDSDSASPAALPPVIDKRQRPRRVRRHELDAAAGDVGRLRADDGEALAAAGP